MTDTGNDPVDARVERQRALARARQQRKRDRDRRRRDGDVTGYPLHQEPGWWTDGTHSPFAETNVAVHLASGAKGREALRLTGYNDKAAPLLDAARERLAAMLKAKSLTIERIAENTVRRIDATSPMLTAEGCIERPDWQAQATGCRDGLMLLDRAGELPSPSQGHGGVTITVNINRPPDVVMERPVEIEITSERPETQ